MSATLNSLDVHNFPIFQPILVKLVSKFMVYKALSDKIYLLSGLLSPLICFVVLSNSILDIWSCHAKTCLLYMCFVFAAYTCIVW